MSTQSIRKNDVLKYIRTSWTYLSKKGFEPKPRVGVFGKNFDDSIDRLAKKMGASTPLIRQFVLELESESLVKFCKNRLVAVREKPAALRHRGPTVLQPMSLGEHITRVVTSTADALVPKAWAEFNPNASGDEVLSRAGLRLQSN